MFRKLMLCVVTAAALIGSVGAPKTAQALTPVHERVTHTYQVWEYVVQYRCPQGVYHDYRLCYSDAQVMQTLHELSAKGYWSRYFINREFNYYLVYDNPNYPQGRWVLAK